MGYKKCFLNLTTIPVRAVERALKLTMTTRLLSVLVTLILQHFVAGSAGAVTKKEKCVQTRTD